MIFLFCNASAWLAPMITRASTSKKTRLNLSAKGLDKEPGPPTVIFYLLQDLVDGHCDERVKTKSGKCCRLCSVSPFPETAFFFFNYYYSSIFLFFYGTTEVTLLVFINYVIDSTHFLTKWLVFVINQRGHEELEIISVAKVISRSLLG